MKSTDCPSCPKCEAAKKPVAAFLSAFAAPARRARQGLGIDSAKKLAKFSEEEILALHGMGKASLPAMEKLLDEAGLRFKSAQPASKKAATKKRANKPANKPVRKKTTKKPV